MSKFRFAILVSIVAISGFSQGMLLPLIAIIFEQEGYSSSVNGLHATGLYIGVLIASPFMEGPLKRFGFKPLILIGGIIVALSLFGFLWIQSFWFWFLLRLLIGVGDHMLHFSTQTWITSISTEEKRGRNISLYGLFFGLGFAAGPLLVPLADISSSLPFILSGSISLIAWLFVFFLKNDFPEQDLESTSFFGTAKRFAKASRLAWVAFLPTFGYGFLEASLNGNYPVYALRTGIDVASVSIILSSFAVGAIVFQLPLGIISDRFGRKNTILFVMLFGFMCFMGASFAATLIPLVICFFTAGMLVGSTFSLGISFMADLLPKNLLPAGNLLCGMFFSIGSISGPFLGGLYIEHVESANFFHVVSFILLLIFITTAFFKLPSYQTAKN
ncbi:MFS transporter [Metabacillus idriensis]|uniref:MFS transporter n=1 Tax=Metabacillus idriensis TaxID=324768 RepID=UPI00174801A9|nr:MFS transporter [Metabacillus idriensis]